MTAVKISVQSYRKITLCTSPGSAITVCKYGGQGRNFPVSILQDVYAENY